MISIITITIRIWLVLITSSITQLFQNNRIGLLHPANMCLLLCMLSVICIIDHNTKPLPSSSTKPDHQPTSHTTRNAPYQHNPSPNTTQPTIPAWPANTRTTITPNSKHSTPQLGPRWGRSTVSSTMPLRMARWIIWRRPNVFWKRCCRKIETNCTEIHNTTKPR